MTDWIHDQHSQFVMKKNDHVTLELPNMTLKARLDYFKNSDVFWANGTAEVRGPGFMRPMLPPEALQPSIVIPIAVKGDGSMLIPDLGPLSYDARLSPRAVRLRSESFVCEYSGPTSNQTFMPVVSISTLANWFGGRLPEELAPFVADKINKSIDAPIRNGHLMHMMARQVCNYEEPIRSLSYESLAMQMITQFLQEICGTDARDVSLTAREIRATREARERLFLDMHAPPSTSELAELSGMSERRLDFAFRELFGTSIFKTLTNARLDHAYAALLTGQVSVKELSFRLGYKHASSFSHAFHARFGLYPSQLRSS